MSEADAIARTTGSPVTLESLATDLRTLGVPEGASVLVHTSLSALGWVLGGATTVIAALEAALGPKGTLMMPTHTGHLCDPAEWRYPPVPERWWGMIREQMPPYDPSQTPTRGVGAVPELFRTLPRVRRSAHPQVSFAARGPAATALLAGHGRLLDFGLGEESPLARLYDLDGWVLLLGVGYDRNTSLHLGEFRAEWRTKQLARSGAPILRDGRRVWVPLLDVAQSTEDFDHLGRDFEAAHGEAVSVGPAGYGTARLIKQPVLVDFAVPWFRRNR